MALELPSGRLPVPRGVYPERKDLTHISINISQQTEARLTEEAQKQGISVDALLERFINERNARSAREGKREGPALPVLDLDPWGLFTGATFITMSVEPGAIDANVPAYALNRAAPRHATSQALVDATLDPSNTLYVTSQILCEFYSVITNPKRFPKVCSAAQAMPQST